MRVWLDDERPMPDGYTVHVKTAQEAIDLLATGQVEKISLDNDLGEPQAGEGRDVARWIERAAFDGLIKKVRCRVHTQNNVAMWEMKKALQNAYRYWMAGEAEQENF